MNQMLWNDDLSVGNTYMDNQHKDIIKLMNMILRYQSENISGPNDELIKHLMKLRIILARHFIEEEDILKQNDCPWFEEHAVDHAYIISMLSETKRMEAKDIINHRIPYMQSLLETHFAIHDIMCMDYLSD